MSKNVLVIGSINVDYVIQTDRIPKLGETLVGSNFSMNFGGKGANQATAIAKQGCSVKMLGAVGSDHAGTLAVENLRSYGIDCDAILELETATGAAVITVCGGDNHIILDAGANALVTPSVIRQSASLFDWADVVVLQYEIPMESVLEAARIAKKHHNTVILNPAPVKDAPSELYTLVDWIIPNEFETELICGIFPADTESVEKAIAALRQKGCKNAIVTLGKRGCCYTDGDKIASFGIYPVTAVDSTAAGDSFIGGLCSKLCEGKPIAEAVAYASAVSAVTVSRAGASCSIPTANEVAEFLKTHSAK